MASLEVVRCMCMRVRIVQQNIELAISERKGFIFCMYNEARIA
jgi:hypothetical protein